MLSAQTMGDAQNDEVWSPMTPSLRQISLPEDLCSAADELYGKRFPSLEKLIVFLLEEVTRRDTVTLDQEERRIIEERLKALGYI
jgi:hypothetical protein